MRAAWAVAVFAVACARPHTDGWTLSPTASIEHQIRAGETQEIEVRLAAGQVLLGKVEQLGADVVIMVFGPSGARLAEIDSPTGEFGVEKLRIDAASSGVYRLAIKAFPNFQGSYRVTVEEITTAAVVAERAAVAHRAVDAQLAKLGPALVATFVPWIREHAIGGDFAGLDRVIGHARAIALGEANHGVQEYLAYRNRLFATLVEKYGVTAYLGESGVVESFVVDDYVTGIGNLSANTVAQRVFSWGMGMPALKENLELIEWMRAYNATVASGRKLHFYGVDLTGARSGRLAASHIALDYVLEYLRASPALHRRFEKRFDRVYEALTALGYLELSSAERKQQTSIIAELVAALDAGRDELIAVTSELAYARAVRAAINLQQIDDVLAGTVSKSSKQEPADPGLLGIRDDAMGKNALWAIDHEGGDGRVFLFAHNFHIRRGRMLWSPKDLVNFSSMGQHVAAKLGDQLVVIGSTHGGGEETLPTFDALLGRASKPELLVDLREGAAADASVKKELSSPWDFRNDGWAGREKPVYNVEPLACFDALIYVSATTDAQSVE